MNKNKKVCSRAKETEQSTSNSENIQNIFFFKNELNLKNKLKKQ